MKKIRFSSISVLFAFTCILVLFPLFSSYPATIELKNGKVLEGIIGSANDSSIILRYNFGEIEFPIKRIQNISNVTTEEVEILERSGFFKKYAKLLRSVPIPENAGALPDESYEYSKKAAIEALQTLKDKMEDNFENEKQDIEVSYTKQVNFFEEKINGLSLRIEELEQNKFKLQQNIDSLTRSKESNKENLSERQTTIRALREEINSVKSKLFEKENETSKKIRSVIDENEKLYEDEISSLKKKYNAEIASLKNDISYLKENKLEKDREAQLTFNETIEKLEKQHAEEKENMEGHYRAQILALKRDYSSLEQRHALQIKNFKKDVAKTREDLFAAEQKADKRIEEKLNLKEKTYLEEKTALMRKFRNQIETLKNEIGNLSSQSEELLKKDSQRQNKFAKIQEQDTLKNEKITTLKNETAGLKEEMADQASVMRKEFDLEKQSLSTIISSSSDKLASITIEKKKLGKNIKLLKEKIKSLELTNLALEEKAELAFREKAVIKHENELLAEQIGDTRRIRDAEKEELIVGIVSEAMQENMETSTIDNEKISVANSAAARAAIIDLYKEDLMKMQAKLQEKDSTIKTLSSEKLSLKTEIDKAFQEKQTAVADLDNVKNRYETLEKEKQEIKNNANLIIKQVQELARSEIEKEKESLRKSYNEVISSIEARSAEQQSITVLEGIPVERTNVDTTVEIPVLVDTAVSSQPETAAVVEATPAPSPQKEEEVEPAGNALVQSGTVSDVGLDFGRIYVETISTINKGDTVWVKKGDGKSYQFKIIQVLPSLKGAIAEIAVIDQIHDIQKNDPVFSKE